MQQAIQENEDLLDMRKKIILTVSHDIRGPLGNIHNCADLLSETREKKKREIYLDDIRHSCQHVLHLVNDLMDAYRINEAGDLHNDTPFYLNRFLKRISDEFSRKAASKGLILYSEHNGSNVTVKGDADKLEQVLANLLTNAIKFTVTSLTTETCLAGLCYESLPAKFTDSFNSYLVTHILLSKTRCEIVCKGV